MKTKSFLKFLVPVVISGILVSCSTSNKVASSFGKRKYTKGFFFEHPTKPDVLVRNSPSVIIPKSGNSTIATPVVASQNEVNLANSPVITVNEKKMTVSTASNRKTSFTKTTNEVSNSNSENTTVVSNRTSSFSERMKENLANDGMAGGGGGNCKSWVVALVLVIFLGGLGIHRFYLGYIWQGVVQLLTGGGCGIWAFIDFIRICMKSLKPKDGDYCE